MIDIEKLAKEHGVDCVGDYSVVFDVPLDKLQKFAEAYHQAKCGQSEPVGFIVSSKFGEMCMFKSTETKKGDMVYTTPQPLKRLSDETVLELYDGSMGYLDFYNAIMDEMERINK